MEKLNEGLSADPNMNYETHKHTYSATRNTVPH